jgi:hypothetical protein
MTKMMPLNRVTILAAFIAILMVLISICGGVRGYSPIPYWDMWDGTLNFVIKVSDGDWGAWWAQHNEHRIILSRLLFWADINWFGGLGISLIVANYFIVGASAFVLFRILHAYACKEINKDLQFVIGFFIVGWLFQWMQSQNFVWGFQSQFLLVQLLPLCSFYYLSKSISFNSAGRGTFSIACLFGLLSVGTMANGVIVLPMMVIYAILYRQTKFRIATLSALTFFSSYLYLVDYVSPGGHGSLFKTITDNPIGLAEYALTYLGSPFHYLARGLMKGLVAPMAGFIFITLYVVLIKKSFASIQNNPLKFALIFFIAFIVATATLTGGGRLLFGVQQALDSRYTTPAIMAWATLLILYSPAIPALMSKAGKLGVFLLICFCLAIFTLQFKALGSESQLNFSKQVAGLALAMGIPDSDRIAAVYPSAEGALGISAIAKQKKLSFFAIEPYISAGKPLGDSFIGDNLEECIGYVDSVDLLKGQLKFGRVSGWIFNPKSQSTPESIAFLNQNNKVVGYAVVGSRRLDVKKSINSSAVRTGFEGYINLNYGGGPITIHGSNGSCLTKPLILPIKPFIAFEDNPSPEKTEISVSKVRQANQWRGADFDRSEFKGMSVYGSYINSDADIGAIELIIRPGDKLFYRSGPTSGSQILEVPGKNISAILPKAQNWTVLEFNGLSGPNGGDVLIRIEDKGANWGEWSAIAIKN